MVPAKFLKDFDTIIFDMDGVLTCEDGYWRCAALTVRELIDSNQYFGKTQIEVKRMDAESCAIADEILRGRDVVVLLKNLGVNSNWDLAYVLLGLHCITGTLCGENLYEHIKNLDMHVPELYDYISRVLEEKYACPGGRNSNLWQLIHDVFNEWYYGDELYFKSSGKRPKNAGKPGLLYSELPMHSAEKTTQLLSTLKDAGKRLAIGTGRPHIDLDIPMERWGFNKFFDDENVITFDESKAAEKKLNMFLSKPNPYVFLKALFGNKYDDKKIISKGFDMCKVRRTLVVGDAGADMFAAKAAGMKFCAVLTGAHGKNAYKFFKDNNADYILDTVLELIE